jgi:hypothetical protein
VRGYVENDSHLQLKRTTNKEIQKQMYEAFEHGHAQNNPQALYTCQPYKLTMEMSYDNGEKQWNGAPGSDLRFFSFVQS